MSLRFYKESDVEFACKCCGLNIIKPRVVKLLNNLIKKVKQNFIITSGCRCRKHNKEVGGRKGSFHLKGLAIDGFFENLSPLKTAWVAEEVGFGGIGVYSNFVHLDARKGYARWGRWSPKKHKPQVKFTPDGFLKFLVSKAVPLCIKYNYYPSILLSQAILETGWGRYIFGNNMFNIKWTDKSQKYIILPTIEYVMNNKGEWEIKKVKARFRSYDNLEDSIEDYLNLLRLNKRYKSVITAMKERKPYQEVAKLIYLCGYATDINYPEKLIRIIEENKLYKYDELLKKQEFCNVEDYEFGKIIKVKAFKNNFDKVDAILVNNFVYIRARDIFPPENLEWNNVSKILKIKEAKKGK